MKEYGNVGKWTLLPRSKAKMPPDYVPEAIREAHYKACVVNDLSPALSSTMSRYCLQQMIRDFWNIPESRKDNIVAELDFISAKLPSETLELIRMLTSYGNISTYMNSDVRLTLLETSPEEAELLIKLNELLFDEWYGTRHRHQARNEKLSRLLKKFEKRLPQPQTSTHPVEALKALPTQASNTNSTEAGAQPCAMDQTGANGDATPDTTDYTSNSRNLGYNN